MIASCSNSNGIHRKAIKSDKKMYLRGGSGSHELKNWVGVYSTSGCHTSLLCRFRNL